MKAFLELMKRVAEWFEAEAYHGGVPRTDYGIIAAAALFDEHCRRKSKPFAYQDAKNMAENRREWIFKEMLECIFSDEHLPRWRKVIMEPYSLLNTVTSPTPHTRPNIYSPLHLMVEALTAKYVWSQYCGLILLGSSGGNRQEFGFS